MELGRALLLLACVGWLTASGARVGGCGTRPLMSTPVPSRVVGGRDALPGAWPWQVSIQFHYRGTNWHICGGIIIDTRWVLTAAHCFLNQKTIAQLWAVVIGLHQKTQFSAHTRIVKVKRIIVHDQFHSDTLNNDIALLQLQKEIVYSDYVQPICVPINSSLAADVNLCFISGWGALEVDGPASDILQEAEVNLIPTKVCNQRAWYDGIITHNMQCAGFEEGAVDSCQGDSGGPLQCFDYVDGRFYVMGVSSFGVHCGLPLKVGVYTRILRYQDWMDGVKAQNGGGRAEPTLLGSTRPGAGDCRLVTPSPRARATRGPAGPPRQSLGAVDT
ncbi:chymotrypsin-like elastase family member 2A [Heptranchias perlo]|uniref:chymotrypsin-like elastase family member 2A n=1 Tax=Heptranchias perlo TaxID=212740 RepID=UPI003559934B